MLGRAIVLASGFCSLTLLAHAAEPTLLHVNTFPTARSLPFYVAVDRGFFARRGLKVELEFTETEVVAGLCCISHRDRPHPRIVHESLARKRLALPHYPNIVKDCDLRDVMNM